MKRIITSMIKQAENEENYDLIRHVKELIEEYAITVNCPSNWRDIGEELAAEYNPSDWVYEELELWNFTDQ